MLILGKEMFILAINAVHGETTKEIMRTLAGMDKNLNKLEMTVRKKVFSHLAISRGQDKEYKKDVEDGDHSRAQR